MPLDEFQLTWRRMERRLREPRVVEDPGARRAGDRHQGRFPGQRPICKPVYEALKALKIETELKHEEEHSAWMVTFKDPTNAERAINIELAAQPEYRRLRSLAKQAAKFNQPAVRGGQRQPARDSGRAGASCWPT